jgi:hypothetical protein
MHALAVYAAVLACAPIAWQCCLWVADGAERLTR